MSTDSNLCFDVIMMIVIIIGGGVIAWAADSVYRGWIKQLDAGATAEVARKAINNLTSNSMMTLMFGVVIGGSVASMSHKWMAAAAALCVFASITAVWLRLERASSRSSSASRG